MGEKGMVEGGEVGGRWGVKKGGGGVRKGVWKEGGLQYKTTLVRLVRDSCFVSLPSVKFCLQVFDVEKKKYIQLRCCVNKQQRYKTILVRLFLFLFIARGSCFSVYHQLTCASRCRTAVQVL